MPGISFSWCPNSKNPFHTCSDYCCERYLDLEETKTKTKTKTMVTTPTVSSFRCCVCFGREGDDDVGNPLKCSRGHEICSECLQGQVRYLAGLPEEQMRERIYVNSGEFSCPSCQENNIDGGFTLFEIAREVDAETFTIAQGAYEKVLRSKHRVEVLQDTIDTAAVEAAQMIEANPGALMCLRCHYGPVLLNGCTDLMAHHNDQGRSNACPRCGWFTNNAQDWLPWDGKLASQGQTIARGKRKRRRKRGRGGAKIKGQSQAEAVPLARPVAVPLVRQDGQGRGGGRGRGRRRGYGRGHGPYWW